MLRPPWLASLRRSVTRSSKSAGVDHEGRGAIGLTNGFDAKTTAIIGRRMTESIEAVRVIQK